MLVPAGSDTKVVVDTVLPSVRYRGNRVVLTARDALLASAYADLAVMSPRGRYRFVATTPIPVYVAGSAPRLRWRVPDQRLTYRVTPGGCRGILARADRWTRRVVVSVPRACLGDPVWVRGVTAAGRLGPRVYPPVR